MSEIENSKNIRTVEMMRMRPASNILRYCRNAKLSVKAIVTRTAASSTYKTYLSVLRLKMLNLFVSFLPHQNY
jgi:hypothetical protein